MSIAKIANKLKTSSCIYAQKNSTHEEFISERDVFLICNINALSETQSTRYQKLSAKLNDFRQSVKELGDGYAFRFKAEADLIPEAAEFIVYARLCCPFFDFELAVEQDANRFCLSLRGQEGIKEFIRSEFNIIED